GFSRDWSSDVCSSDLRLLVSALLVGRLRRAVTRLLLRRRAVARLLAVRAPWWVGHVRPLVFSRPRTHGALAFRAGQWGDGQPTLRCAVVHRHRHGTTIRVRRVAMSAVVPVLRAPWALAPLIEVRSALYDVRRDAVDPPKCSVRRTR